MSDQGTFDWEELRKTIVLSTRFLDNVVTANEYVPGVEELQEAALGVRRIGLGFMGLADVMYAVGIRYGSEDGQEFVAQISEFIRFHAMKTSIELAKERGSFPKIKGSIYDKNNIKWKPPRPLKPFKRNWNRPELDWKEITKGIKRHGIRNGAQTTVAPTGTISTVAGVEGYGCEPNFALAYYRNVYQASGKEERLTLTYVSPSFKKALDTLEISDDAKTGIIEKVIEKGTCQGVEEIPERMRNTFVVSADIKPEEHILMQASIQAFVDNSISKTCNFPEGATREDISKVYTMGWELGCKGLTVYVTGSRSEVVLETKETKDKRSTQSIMIEPQRREYKVSGVTYKIQTPQGKAFITVNHDNGGKPFEIFLNVGKAGSDVAALSEALGRLMSGWLRVSHSPEETAKEIITQLIGIGGAKSVGFGRYKVSSVADAVAKVLVEEFEFEVKNLNGLSFEGSDNTVVGFPENKSPFSRTDMCPECGNYSLVYEEGCEKCYYCAFSVC